MATAFEATANYTAEVVSVTLNVGGSGSVLIQNRDANGVALSQVTIAIPADRLANVQHQRTGDAGVVISLDFSDAITVALAQSIVLMNAVIANEKHAL